MGALRLHRHNADAQLFPPAVETIELASLSLQRLADPESANSQGHWATVITDQLQWVNIGSELHRSVNGIAIRLIQELTKSARDKHKRRLASVAKAGQLLFWLHEHDALSDPSRVQRASAWAFKRLNTKANPKAHREYEPSDTLLLWVLGAIGYGAQLVELTDRYDMMREQQRQLGALQRWPSHRFQDRKQDLKRLVGHTQPLRATLLKLIPAAGIRADNAIELTELWEQTSRPNGCTCGDPHGYYEALFGDHLTTFWNVADTDHEAAAIQEIYNLSSLRGDLLYVDREYVVIEPQGFFDALLAYCLGQIPDRAGSEWHESRIAEQARKTWAHHGKVRAGQAWIRQPSDLATNSTRPLHGGEFDAMVIADNTWLIDIQAKAASSPDLVSREKVISVSALKQHERLRDAGPSGIWLVRSLPQNKGERLGMPHPLHVGDNGLTHLPISVGTELVHQWPIGRSLTTHGIARVYTTLDHLRTVNDLVPALLRPVYWADRYAQEHDEMMFIDENDYLEKWLAIFRGEPVAVQPFQDRSDASGGPVGGYFHFINMYALDAGPAPLEVRKHINALRSYIWRGSMFDVAPTLTKGLTQLREKRSPYLIDLLRAVVGTNAARIESGLAEGIGLTFDGGRGKWAIYPESFRSQPDRPDVDFLVRNTRTGWTLTVPPGREEPIRRQRKKPRFSAKDFH